jgi:hypothetical protein
MGIAGAVLYSLVLMAGRGLYHLTSRASRALFRAWDARSDGPPFADARWQAPTRAR